MMNYIKLYEEFIANPINTESEEDDDIIDNKEDSEDDEICNIKNWNKY